LAYGNVTSYEPVAVAGTSAADAYKFTDKSGASWTLMGKPALDLKARLDAANALQPQPVAGPGTGVVDPARLSKLMNEQAATTQAQAKLDTGMAGPALATKPSEVRQGTTEGYTPGAPPRYVQFAQGKGGSILELREGADPNNPQPGDIRVYQPGSAGSKGGLTLRGETRQGVQPVDPAFLEAQDDLQIDRRMELQNQQDAQLAQAEQLRQHKEEMAVIAANEQAEAARRQQEIEKRVVDLQGRYDKAEKEVATTKIDPNGGSNFLEAVFVGLGTVGSIINKTPNYALEIAQRRIDRHIAAQERALDVKRDTKNDLSRMLEVTKGNRDLARQALVTAYTKKAAATFEARAANTANQELKATMGLAALNMQDAYLVRRKAWEDAGRGEVTQSFVNTPAQAPTQGGYRLATLEEQQGSKGALAPQSKPKTDAEVAGSADKQKRRAAIRASIVALKNFASVSEKAGTVVQTGSGASKESQALGAAAGALGPMVARSVEGDAATKDSMDRAISGLTAADPAAREAARQAYIQQLETLDAAIEAE